MEICHFEINEFSKKVNLFVEIVEGGPLAERLTYWLLLRREKVKKSEKAHGLSGVNWGCKQAVQAGQYPAKE